jgi:hypothetical protein
MVFDRAGFMLLKGMPKVYKAQPHFGGYSFCETCGIHVFSQPNSNPDLVAIKVGSLDDPPDFRVDADIWMQSAPPWHRAHEGAKRVEGNLTSHPQS